MKEEKKVSFHPELHGVWEKKQTEIEGASRILFPWRRDTIQGKVRGTQPRV